MGFLFDEKKFINDNIFQYEQRMNSQYTKFLDKSPNFTTYYHINNISSTADLGFQSIERIIGPNSPIKFKVVKDFPVYGLDNINLNLSDEDQGLDSNYDSELIILPNTIQPLPNDCFVFNYLDQNYIFKITEVQYDTIKSNNYYKISYTVNSLTEDMKAQLDLQVDEKYVCNFTNIGTKEKCLIKEEDSVLLVKLNQIYRDIVNKYRIIFFNTKYNSFLFNNGEYKIYDKYLNHFIQTNKLLNETYNYETTFCVNEDFTNTFPLEYEQCIYRIIEKCKKAKLPTTIQYIPWVIENLTSIFKYYRDSSVMSVKFISGQDYINPDLLTRIQTGEKLEEDNIIDTLLIDFFNENTQTIYNIDLNKLSEYDEYIDLSFETFIKIPILLYILKFHYTNFMSIK
jgi:hypothetical protein